MARKNRVVAVLVQLDCTHGLGRSRQAALRFGEMLAEMADREDGVVDAYAFEVPLEYLEAARAALKK